MRWEDSTGQRVNSLVMEYAARYSVTFDEAKAIIVGVLLAGR